MDNQFYSILLAIWHDDDEFEASGHLDSHNMFNLEFQDEENQ